jgi:hypothetical protein
VSHDAIDVRRFTAMVEDVAKFALPPAAWTAFLATVKHQRPR